MSIMTKKEIEAIKKDVELLNAAKADAGCGRLKYIKPSEAERIIEDRERLVKTIEEAIKVIESNHSQLKQMLEWDGEDFETMKYIVRGQFGFNNRFLSQYEKEN